jgi:hypothetical protein
MHYYYAKTLPFSLSNHVTSWITILFDKRFFQIEELLLELKTMQLLLLAYMVKLNIGGGLVL